MVYMNDIIFDYVHRQNNLSDTLFKLKLNIFKHRDHDNEQQCHSLNY